MDAANLHRRAVDFWESRVTAVGPDQWGAATPCSEWNVRDLVNHVVGEELWLVPLLHGSTIEEVGDRFDGDVLGADPVGTARRAAEQARTAADQAAPDAKVHLSYGDDSAEEYLRQLAADHLIHGWDLAVATGDTGRLDQELVAEVAAWFADHEEAYRAAGAIGPRVASSGDPQGDLLARFGRDARWAARS